LFVSLLIVGCGGGGGDNNNNNNNNNESEVQFKTISAGGEHSLALSNDGKVYATGYNYFGQLGLGNNTNINTFTEIPSLSGKTITALSAGGEHSLALSNDGKVYATGQNSSGELGLGDNNYRNTFTEVTDLSDKNITALFAGNHYSLALSNDGKVYATGHNNYGQLGLNDTANRNTFTKVGLLNDKNITALSAGNIHSLALSDDGEVYAAGYNYYGQLGLGNNDNKNVFTEVTSLNGKTIAALSACHAHSLALSDDGKVYTAGNNQYGQLGLDDTTDRNAFTEVTDLSDKNITALFAGYFHSLALSNDGKVYAAGWNNNGQLGLGDNDGRNTFTEVTDLSDKNITSISAGYYHSLVLSSDRKIYATGDNDNSQLGLGDNTDRKVFTEVTDLDD
jgi:alpha-tubulin suppressor-like RCC1 family protein